MNILMLYK